MTEQQTLSRETMQITLKQYIQAFASMTAENYRALLEPLFDEQVYFEDPFNQLRGKTATLAVFEHMYQTLNEPKFEIFDYSLSEASSEPAANSAMIYWKFRFKLDNGKAHEFDGISRVTFSQSGQIVSHIDYWDPAKHIYQKIPIIGWILRKIRSKLSLPTKN